MTRAAARRYTRRTVARRRLAVLAALAAVGVVAALALLVSPQRGGAVPAASEDASTPLPDETVRAFMIATGIFAVPPPGQGPPEYQAAEAAARQAHTPLAVTLWTDDDPFQAHAWRDLLQVGRIPINRPPNVDFMREVAVLVWPVGGEAPDAVRHARGLQVRGATVQHVAVNLRIVAATAGPFPATPNAGHDFAPYVLATVPRNQWPIPAPPPTVPPLAVTLVQ